MKQVNRYAIYDCVRLYFSEKYCREYGFEHRFVLRVAEQVRDEMSIPKLVAAMPSEPSEIFEIIKYRATTLLLEMKSQETFRNDYHAALSNSFKQQPAMNAMKEEESEEERLMKEAMQEVEDFLECRVKE